MAVYPVLAATFIMKILAVIFFICALLLVLIVLIQKGKGGGLSAAFSGGAASGILGTKSKEPLTWVTIALACIFLTLGVILAKYYKPEVSAFESEQPAPAQQSRTEQPTPPFERAAEQPGDMNEGVSEGLPGG